MNDEKLIHSIVRQVRQVRQINNNKHENNNVIGHPLEKDNDIVYADGSITCSSGISNDLPRYNDPQKQREL